MTDKKIIKPKKINKKEIFSEDFADGLLDSVDNLLDTVDMFNYNTQPDEIKEVFIKALSFIEECQWEGKLLDPGPDRLRRLRTRGVYFN